MLCYVCYPSGTRIISSEDDWKWLLGPLFRQTFNLFISLYKIQKKNRANLQYSNVKMNVNVSRTKYFGSFYATRLHNHEFYLFHDHHANVCKILHADKASGKSVVASKKIVLRIRSIVAHCTAQCTQLNRPSTTDCQFKIITTSIELHFT